jgi:hypothetical protein
VRCGTPPPLLALQMIPSPFPVAGATYASQPLDLLLLLTCWLLYATLHLQATVRNLLPGHLEAQPELRDRLSFMLSPSSLQAAGVRVCATTQVCVCVWGGGLHMAVVGHEVTCLQ